MKKTILFLLMTNMLLFGCGKKDSSSRLPSTDQTDQPLKEVVLIPPSGDPIQTSLAYKKEDLQRGLSGVPSASFGHDQGKFFFYFAEATRTFWMPNTFFALDIFYLNSELKIERIVRDLPAYSGSSSEEIPRAPAIRSRHVLELKADSPIADSLQINDQFSWQSSLTIDETEEAMKESL